MAGRRLVHIRGRGLPGSRSPAQRPRGTAGQHHCRHALPHVRTRSSLTNARGRLPNDRPHMLRAMGSVEAPRTGFVLAANVQHFTGKPWAAARRSRCRRAISASCSSRAAPGGCHRKHWSTCAFESNFAGRFHTCGTAGGRAECVQRHRGGGAGHRQFMRVRHSGSRSISSIRAAQ